MTDLLTGLLCTSLTATVSVLRHLQLIELCAIRRCFCSTFVTLSSLFVGFACFDRYLAITRPLRYHSLINHNRAKAIIISSALLSAMIGGSSVFPSSKTTLCISNFSSDSALPFRPSLLLSLIVFFTSLGVAIYTNTRVVIVAVRQSVRVANEPLNDNAPDIVVVQRLRPALRGLSSVVIATSAYFIAVIPWAIVTAAQLNPATTISSPDVRFFTSLLLLSNSYWNAFIFLLLNRKFRAAVKLTLGFKEASSSDSYTMPSTNMSK